MAFDTARAEPIRLETRRLTIRRPVAEDQAALIAALNDRRIAGMLSRLPHPYTETHARDFIAASAEDSPFSFLLAETKTGALVGGVELIERVAHTYALGYWVAAARQGEGLATEAAQAIIDFAFAGLGAARVEAVCRVGNTGSRRVLERCGFQLEGSGLAPTLLSGMVCIDRFRLDRRLWASLRDWRQPIMRSEAAFE